MLVIWVAMTHMWRRYAGYDFYPLNYLGPCDEQ